MATHIWINELKKLLDQFKIKFDQNQKGWNNPCFIRNSYFFFLQNKSNHVISPQFQLLCTFEFQWRRAKPKHILNTLTWVSQSRFILISYQCVTWELISTNTWCQLKIWLCSKLDRGFVTFSSGSICHTIKVTFNGLLWKYLVWWNGLSLKNEKRTDFVGLL